MAHDITGVLSPQSLTPCPQCHETAVRQLMDSSQMAYVDYFRCVSCGHVYNQSKGVPNAPHVTVAEGRRASA